MRAMDLPGYDEWKLRDPDEGRCEYCGASMCHTDGWQPDACTGECGRGWRDPDAEYDAARDDGPAPEPPGGWDD